MSVVPVREAIRRLEAEGWVVYNRNQGAQIAPIDAQSWIEAMGTLAVIEGYATALAAPHLTAEDFKQLHQANREMERALENLDVLAASEHNLRFHRVIRGRCPNAHMRDEVAAIQERLNTLRNTIFLHIPTRGLVSVTEHAGLIALLELGADPAAIERFAREHRMSTIAAFKERSNDA